MIDANQDKMYERNTQIVEKMLEESMKLSRPGGRGGTGVYCRRNEHNKCMYGMCRCDCHKND